MTMNDQRALEEAADGYRQEGYTVEVRPSGACLPGFLADLHPDLIARKNGEQVVAQVRRLAELRGDKDVSHLAAVVNAEPGWRFDLIVPAPNHAPTEAWAEADEPSDADINALLDEARKLLDLQLHRPALVAAWAAVEAAMRHLARKEQVPLERRSPRFVLNTLASAALLSRADYERLDESLRWRDAVIHGMQPNGLGSEEPSALLDIARRLLDWAPAAASA
jgi:REase_AHJR-like